MMQLRCCLAATLAALAAPMAAAAEAYAIWDNFDGATEVDAHRWQRLERTRQIEGGQLRFVQRDLGNQTGDSGTSGGLGTRWTARLQNAAAITRIRAVITVNDVWVSNCAANPSRSDVFAAIDGAFFNAGAATPTSRLDNVGAAIGMGDPGAPGMVGVGGVVYRCTTSDCSNPSIIGEVSFGMVPLGQAVQLTLDWDKANKRFAFTRGNDQTLYPTQYVNYTVGDSLSAFGAYRQIGTGTELANCFSGPRTEGYIDAKFDKVSVNKSALP